MKWFKKLKNKTDMQEAANEAPTITLNPTIEELQRFFNTRLTIAPEKLKSATYYACMQIRCNAIAKLPLKLMRQKQNEGSVKATDHPLYRLMKNRPNRFTNAHDFLWATEYQRLEHGNAFWVMQYKRHGNAL